MVSLAQLGLKRAGFLDAEPDGIFGKQTQNAVQRIQRSAGIRQDGIIGPRTWGVLDPFLLGFREIRVQRGDSFFALRQNTAFQRWRWRPQIRKLIRWNSNRARRSSFPYPFPWCPETYPIPRPPFYTASKDCGHGIRSCMRTVSVTAYWVRRYTCCVWEAVSAVFSSMERIMQMNG